MAQVTFEDTNAGGQAPNPGAAAYACSRLGLRVFPLTPGAGLPALKAWPDIATTDVDVIQGWWSGEYGGYGVGVATGPESNIFVVDIDVKHGVDGYDTWVNLVLKHGPIPNTLMVQTRSGGAHVYFRWAEGVANSTGTTNRLGPGLDVRGHHGYVRAPGWDGYQVIRYEGERRTHIGNAPAWLVELAQKRKYEREGEAMRTQVRDSSWARYQTGRALETLENAPAGTRNDALNKTAFRLAAADVLLEAEAWEACWAIMARIGGGDKARERRTFESGWRAGLERRGGA